LKHRILVRRSVTRHVTRYAYGPYEILSPIGARLKTIRSDKVDQGSRRRFLQEARAVSTVNGPNIVDLYDILSHGVRDVLVMEHGDGKPLNQLIPARRLRLSQVLSWSIQIDKRTGYWRRRHDLEFKAR
jgi:serine/threonine protein kinase